MENNKQTFEFTNQDINAQFIESIKLTNNIKYKIINNQTVQFLSHEEMKVIEIVIAICDTLYDNKWQMLFCPPDCINLYRLKMNNKKVPYQEFIHNGEIQFLLPRRFRPHSWKLSN